MELRQLEYFRAIVDAGTISGAARVLHMTQPPLSYQIKMLEEEFQVPLLIRGTKKITLTEAGKTLYEQAGTLLMFADLTRREVVKSSQSATLHIGMTPSTVSLLADYLLRFSWKYPHIHFDVHEGSTFALKDQLENHMVDLTTLRTPIVLNGCETKTLLKESITAMALPSHPLFAGRETLSLTELAEQPQTLQPKSCLPGARGAFRLNFGLFWNCGMKMTPSIIKFMFPNRNRLRQFFILIRFTDLN